MNYLLHGFLGFPEDWSFINSCDYARPSIHDSHHLDINEETTLVGYSLGGRIALSLAAERGFSLKRLVLISSHIGLRNNSERLERENKDSLILKNLKKMSGDEFLSYWNSLDVFTHDLPLKKYNMMGDNVTLFERWKLSRYPYYLEEIIKNKTKIVYIYGDYDETYKKIGIELRNLGVPVRSIESGHRCLSQPEKLYTVLKEFL